MRNLEEKEFDQIDPTKDPSECNPHEVVRLCQLGTHLDYGCIKCKMKSSNKDDFYK